MNTKLILVLLIFCLLLSFFIVSFYGDYLIKPQTLEEKQSYMAQRIYEERQEQEIRVIKTPII